MATLRSKLRSPLVLLLSAASAGNIALWLLALLAFPQDSQTAVLHYSVDVGIDFVGESQQIIVLPAAGLIILIGNAALGLGVHKASAMAAWILWSITPLVQIALIGAFFLIWKVNQ